MKFEFSEEFALNLDRKDPFGSYRDKFHIPKVNNKDSIYFTGNSLGLQPKTVRNAIEEELNNWSEKGVEGHFTGDKPWFTYHKNSKSALAGIVGAKPDEVILMNSLTVNLHLMMVSFYRPSQNRYKIIMEAGAFPSDQYAVESQIKFHGYDPEEAIIELHPKIGEHLLENDDILQSIKEHKNEVALIIIGGVQYFTGQFFDLEAITIAGHEAGAQVGFDLAHAAGNVPLQLHDWNVDFAVWCTYKYINGGPGNIAGAFVHENQSAKTNLPRFAGWWGHDEDERFLMKKSFIPTQNIDGWQLSNTNVLATASVNASLEIFSEAGMPQLRQKSLHLTGYAEFMLNKVKSISGGFTIITPAEPSSRGCQLSIQMDSKGKEVFDTLSDQGVVADWREPTVDGEKGIIRIAPVPLYNSFLDVFRFTKIFQAAIDKGNG